MTRRMPNSPLALSAHQTQTLGDLGIDAWYLTPLTRAAVDAEFQASQESIAEIVDQLTAGGDNSPHVAQSDAASGFVADNHLGQSNDTASMSPSASSLEPTPTLGGHSTIHSAELPNAGADSATRQGSRAESVAQVVSHVTANVSAKGVTAQSGIAGVQAAMIQLNPNLDLRPPADTRVVFPHVAASVNPTLDGVNEAITALQENNAGVGSHQTITGQGSQSPDWLVIVPPPTLAHVQQQQLFNDSEKQLFDEVLQSIQQPWDKVHVTPLLKQSVFKNKDPDQALLDLHLPVLSAEITCLKPRRILLMGRVPNHALLSTKAPLSELMSVDYELQVGEHVYPLTVLPSLHYFLALPAQKSLLWQRIKQLA